jgi:hypothetical protein
MCLLIHGTDPAIPYAIGHCATQSPNTTNPSLYRSKDFGNRHSVRGIEVCGLDTSIGHFDRGKSSMIETVDAPGNAFFFIHSLLIISPSLFLMLDGNQSYTGSSAYFSWVDKAPLFLHRTIERIP